MKYGVFIIWGSMDYAGWGSMDYALPRCLNGCLSSYGQQLMMGYSPLTILSREVGFWLIGVVYATVMGNQWITSFFIVSFLMPYGAKLLQCLGSNG